MKALSKVMMLVIVLGLLTMSANGLSRAVVDPEVFSPPASSLYQLLLAILIFTLAVIGNENPELINQMGKSLRAWPGKLREIAASSSSIRGNSPVSDNKINTKMAKSPNREDMVRLQERIALLESENAELKQLVGELSIELRKLARKK